MRKITIYISERVPLSSLAVPLDVFMAAGVFGNMLCGEAPAPLFDTKTVTIDGNPIRTLDGLEIKPDASIDDVRDSETIIITPAVDPTIPSNDNVVEWLRRAHEKGVHIASICTGAFLLAETGLLNCKTATTHWGFKREFKKRFPDVILKTEKMITDEGDLFCSGGANAGGDLSLYLVAKYIGRETAIQTARSLLMDMDRMSQSIYSIFNFEKSHGDEDILSIQNWIESHYKHEIKVDLLCRRARMSRRVFERRFKLATGDSPLRYIQRVRIENAKRLLEKGHTTFDEITYLVGYEDSSTFSRIFKKDTGLSPGLYKKKYGLKRL